MKGPARSAFPLLVSTLAFIAGAAAAAQEGASPYSYYGNVGLSAASSFDGRKAFGASGEDASLDGDAFLEMNHRFSMDKAELFIHHSITQRLRRDVSTDEADSPQTVPTPDFALYEAYLRLFPSQGVSISLGRHRISWGNGLLLSPSDSFQPSAFQGTGGSPGTLRDSSAQTGFTGAGAQFFPGPDITVSLGVSVDDAVRSGALNAEAVRGGGIAWFVSGPFEYFLSGAYQKDGTARPGAGASLDMLGSIVRFEAALECGDAYAYPADSGGSLSFDETNSPRPGLSAGIEKVFTAGDYSVSLFTEYLYLGWGYDREEERLAIAAMDASYSSASSAAVPSPLGKQYANFLAEVGRVDSWDFENLFMVDLAGPSIMADHSFTYLGFKNVSLKAGLTWLAGDRDTEFGVSSDTVFTTIEAKVNF